MGGPGVLRILGGAGPVRSAGVTVHVLARILGSHAPTLTPSAGWTGGVFPGLGAGGAAAWRSVGLVEEALSELRNTVVAMCAFVGTYAAYAAALT
ncbi:hypothetical protein GCM10010339_01010 [Streptomyces alanosinicus]|uniref:Uncharacterized protein n=1 Tax=Streptomyces alanosinicus TaxID=68171 RepID=A0A919CYW2_9ACTN|nr:hypothetical protein GCM10010339_01010 [Streptomyces alanosinicus]